jgi:hypothetical protein
MPHKKGGLSLEKDSGLSDFQITALFCSHPYYCDSCFSIILQDS